MNHDATHCGDYCEECPKTCYRAQLTEELKHVDYPLPVSYAMFKNTDYCPKWPKPKKIGQRLTKAQSQEVLIQDHDIPVIPPLRIKLESTGPVGEDWLRGAHGDLEGDSVMVLNMKPGGDIVQGIVRDKE